MTVSEDTDPAVTLDRVISAFNSFVTNYASADGVITVRNVKDYGALGDGTTDDTAAFDAAIADTGAAGAVIYIPRGNYRVHEVAVDTLPYFVGAGHAYTKISYNGAGGADSSVFDMTYTGGGALTATGFEEMDIRGWQSGGNIAESCIRHRQNGSVDWGYRLSRLRMALCFGNAFHLPGGIVNFHMDQIRWDGVGGYPIYIEGNGSMEQRPFSLSRFTYDNDCSGSFATAAAAQGYYDGTRWGKGFMYVKDCVDSRFHLYDGRIEFNNRLTVVNNRTACFYVDSSIAGNMTLVLDQVNGFAQALDAVSWVYDPTGKALVQIDGYSMMSNIAVAVETSAATPAGNIRGGPFFSSTSMRSLASAAQGININGQTVEWRAAAPTGSVFYQQGDVVFNDAAVAGGNVGWQVTAPTTGFGNAAGPTYDTAAVVTSGSAVVVVSAASLRRFGVGTAITINGAGVASAALNTVVTDIDVANHTITVADSPSTSVNPATILIRTPTFSTFGFVGEKRGATSVADGGTVTHSVGTTPTWVQCTPSVAGEMVSVTALGATTFTVAIKKHDNTAGTTQTIYWRAMA